MSKCVEFKFDMICEIIFDKFFPWLTGIRTHAHVHHSVAMGGGRSNHSASGADKVIRVGPAWSYCHPMMYFIIYIYNCIQYEMFSESIEKQKPVKKCPVHTIIA